jgi:alpha-L-fucosidase
MELAGKEFKFGTLHVCKYINDVPLEPLLFIKHPASIVSFYKPGIYTLKIKPLNNGKNLLNLKDGLLEPVH